MHFFLFTQKQNKTFIRCLDEEVILIIHSNKNYCNSIHRFECEYLVSFFDC